MHIRRFFALCSLILLGGILVACGAEDDPDPTATVAPTIAPAETATDEATIAATEVASMPEASPAATPVTAVEGDATPVMPATPATDDATPVTEDVAAPAVLPAGSGENASTPEAEAEPVPMNAISGTLTLDGRAQQDYTLSNEGCVGLGEWRQLKPGTQVIVRDATGTVVDIATLESADAGDACMWSFDLDVPGADFFSVSIPMVTEVWFAQDDSAVQAGEIELFVP